MPNRKRVVIVEDEFDLCAVLQDHFGKTYHITVFNDAESCLDAASTLDTASVIIVDYKLPEMNGIDLFKALKPQLPKAKFVFITGYLTEEMAIEGLKVGFDALLMKPFDIQAMDKTIADLANAN